MHKPHILVIGVGGLGACMVQEALERDLKVSVLVRNKARLSEILGEDLAAKLERVIVGDGNHTDVLDDALAGVDVVLSGRGADPVLAQEFATAVKRNQVQKLCWPGGTTNVLAEDGVTLNYLQLGHLGDWVEGAYQAHKACIDAIKNAQINYVIFCPGRMSGAGQRSADVQASIRINRDAGPFVSYEDAAWVMLEAATTDRFDGQLVSAATAQ